VHVYRLTHSAAATSGSWAPRTAADDRASVLIGPVIIAVTAPPRLMAAQGLGLSSVILLVAAFSDHSVLSVLYARQRSTAVFVASRCRTAPR